MGFAEDVVYSYVERSLRRVYPAREGWEVKRKPKKNENVPDYFIQKKRFGRTHRVLVSIALLPQITSEEIDPLVQYAQKMETLLLPTEELVLVVPTGADISAVPEEIGVLFLDVLKVEDNIVVWVKKKRQATGQVEQE